MSNVSKIQQIETLRLSEITIGRHSFYVDRWFVSFRKLPLIGDEDADDSDDADDDNLYLTLSGELDTHCVDGWFGSREAALSVLNSTLDSVRLI